MLTNDYRMSRENLLKSEALLTLCAESAVPHQRLNGPSRDLTARRTGRAEQGFRDA